MARGKSTIEEVVDLTQDLNDLTVDKISSAAPKEEPITQEMSLKERAKLEGALYIEGKKVFPPIGTLPDKWKKEHDRDWEYVKGIYENNISPGESLSFAFCKWPGDWDMQFTIPCNIPVYVPRMIAEHLEKGLAYHTFDYRQRPDHQWRVDDFTHKFSVVGTKYRGMFRPIGAFQ